jgi:S-adenosylmethionine hydrolase
MPVITLTSDLGLSDHYVAMVKGKLLKLISYANVIDISHQIKAYNTIHAAFVLRNAYHFFPEGSIHLVSVKPVDQTEGPFTLQPQHLVMKYNNHYFIGPDNGLFSMILEGDEAEIIRIEIAEIDDRLSMPIQDLYVRAAAAISHGEDISTLGIETKEINEKSMFRASLTGNVLQGIIAHVDQFGNLHTNISENYFKKVAKDRSFSIDTGNSSYALKDINRWYSEVTHGERLALFNASGLLEIAINQGNASKLLGLGLQSPIRIEFYD